MNERVEYRGRMVPRRILNNAGRPADEWDGKTSLRISRPEELYALMSSEFRGKNVLVVDDDDWRNAPPVSR